MFERAYRQRLEADLARWHADGVIAPGVREAIRRALGPLPKSVSIATVVGLVGGLLIAAAFLAFIAANWTEIARPLRFAILLAGIVGAHALGAFFSQTGRTFLADSGAAVGSIIFGAAIALVGQMYHIGGDFAGGMFLWAGGALAAALLTGSRGALAVALAVGCIWSSMRVFDDAAIPHLPFIAFWLIGAVLAVSWNSAVARHLVALAAVYWWFLTGAGLVDRPFLHDPAAVTTVGGCFVLGAGLALANYGPLSLRAFGVTLSHYGAFAFAIALAVMTSRLYGSMPGGVPAWVLICGGVGMILAFVAAAIEQRWAVAVAGIAIALGIAAAGFARPSGDAEPWLAYALALLAMLALVVSGMLDDARPRIVAGWIGLACVIMAITWGLKGSLLRRSLFLAIAGVATMALASVLGRLIPKEADR
jgi:uncharacterized membrane protein